MTGVNGKFILILPVSQFIVALRFPLNIVSKWIVVSFSLPLTTLSNKTFDEASVACPHNSISVVGENQRIVKWLGLGWVIDSHHDFDINAVSLKLSCAPIFAFVSSVIWFYVKTQ